MNSLVSNILRRTFLANYSISRSIATTSLNRIKQIEIVQEKDELKIKATIVPSGLEKLLVPEFNECKKNGKHFCVECTLGLEIKHTDVLILSQYLRPDGCMLPQRTTGLCRRMQKRIGTMVTMAQWAGLMPLRGNTKINENPMKRGGWRKFNQYYDETTIRNPGEKKRFRWTNYKNNMAYEKVKRLL